MSCARKKSRLFNLLAASLLGVAGASCADAGNAVVADSNSVVVYIARRSWHIDIGFAAADLEPPLKSLANDFPGVQYIFFGFGDRRYLESRHRNAPVLLAALWPGSGLILATGLKAAPQDAFGAPQVVSLKISVSQARDIQIFVWHSLAKAVTEQDVPVTFVDKGPYEGSLYFSATAQYSGFHTCNTWAAESLKAGGLPIRSVGVLFAAQLWRQVRRLQNKQLAIAQAWPIAGARPQPLRINRKEA